VEPTYIEPKAYVHVGWSQRRLGYENTPSYDEVKGFSEKLCEKTGYHLLDESPPSRVTLLSRLSAPRRFTSKPILERNPRSCI
jgi:tRNA wybutosine-synthesizing protein 1